jgi:hypothetical protein
MQISRGPVAFPSSRGRTRCDIATIARRVNCTTRRLQFDASTPTRYRTLPCIGVSCEVAMDLSTMVGRLMRLVRGEPASPRERSAGVDAADMGTAFGLEASLLDFDPSECDAGSPELPRWHSTHAR